MRSQGFTLLELLIVVAIIAAATGGVSLALRDSSQTLLEREAQRLAALLDVARAQSRASGVAVRWRATREGFAFDGWPPPRGGAQTWLDANTTVALPASLLLGPEPIIGAQSVTLRSKTASARALTVATDGVRAFAVLAPAPSAP